MRYVAVALTLGLCLAAGGAAAQSVDIGQPERDDGLDDGMIAVRLIAEKVSQPVAGESVTLLGPGDAVLTARTGASGWARFPGLSPGAQYVARVELDDEQRVDSEPIEVPSEGGVRVTLSTESATSPKQHAPAGAAAGEAAGEATGMPDPRQMSGIPRGERGDPPGRLTVRAVQGKFSPTESTAPEGAVIHLVGYGVDGSVTHESAPVPDEGRVVFDDLAIDRTRAYYALAVFDRGDVQDRLLSSPVTMPGNVGVRLMLAGLDPDSDEGPVDDVSEHAGTREPPVPPGQVVARLFGRVGDVSQVELVELGGSDWSQRSPAKQGSGMREARFRAVPSGPDKVYAAQVRTDRGVYRSMPFQLTEERGATVGAIVFDNVLLRFHLIGEIDDERLWFDAQLGLRNPTTAPLMPKGERLSIPLPKGFVNAVVREQDQTRVQAGSDGFIWSGPVGPGQQAFRGQFALPIEGGGFEFDMALPHGSWNSQIIMEKLPGMTLQLPGVQGMKEETRPLSGREFTLLGPINIEHGRRLVLSGEGLPQRSMLEAALRWAAGLVVLGLLGWGFVGLFRRRGDTGDRRESLAAQRDRLLDELAALERQHQRGEVAEGRYRRSRDNLRLELENVYAELGVGASEGERASS